MKLKEAVDYLARLQGIDEIPVSEAARRLKKTSFWVHQNFPIIVHGPKSHHVRLSEIEAYQAKRTVFPMMGKSTTDNTDVTDRRAA